MQENTYIVLYKDLGINLHFGRQIYNLKENIWFWYS